MQNWTELYTELTTKIVDNLPNISWIDLWRSQVNFSQEEPPFPTPAVFLSFKTLQTEDTGQNVQHVNLQVDFYLFHEAFTAPNQVGGNNEITLQFLQSLNDLYVLFHGTSGANYSNMRRLSFKPVDTENSANLYQISFECLLVDYAAMKEYAEGRVGDISLESSTESPPKQDWGNGFVIRD